MSTPAVSLREIRKSYGADFALGPITLNIPRGSICALVGPNGAGKSTLLNLLMGIAHPDGGRATLLDHDVKTADVEVKRRTAFVSPDLNYRAWGTVGRAVDFVSAFYPDWSAQRCQQLLHGLGLHRGERIDALSFGARVKLSAVIALAREAELLLLDEPTAGLDPLARQLLFTELLRYMQNEERTIIISSHQLTELERFADHVAILNRGKLITFGAIPDLLARYVQVDALIGSDRALPRQGAHVIARDGNRARLLVDRSILELQALEPLGIDVIGKNTLTLEELFVALLKRGGTVRWQPRMVAA
jgi:ABC-2 type transport system ATP-binding protein